MIYFDNSATTFPDKDVLECFFNTTKNYWGNPSSIQGLGRKASVTLEEARNICSDCLGVRPREIVFTSSGTESNNTAIKSIALQYINQKKHIITTSVEHASVYNTCKQLEEWGFSVTYLSVNKTGHINIEELKRAIRSDTILVSIMHVNSELGSIQPIKEIGELLKNYPAITFHVDAVQAFGKVDIDITNWNIDLLSLSSHKFHSPRGAGILYVREGVYLPPLLVGGGQEYGQRSGTENVASIVAMSKAMEKQCEHIERNNSYLNSLKNHLLSGLRDIPNCHINSSTENNNAPHIINFSIEGILSDDLIRSLEKYQIFVSKSSACSSSNANPSRVLTACGLNKGIANSAIRVSFSTHNTLEEVESFLFALIREIFSKAEV
ncbi:cysteine desulfurase NifS [Priestia aryabhattai]|uniref:cysteine desulfurase family protein n=1 Tax=Bacillus sp. CBEL-1 TaxID=2502980 RepID=UPI000BA00060|nr:cysteine desulfurase family protein [Bacillus sp. CBEL-1]OZT13752.1 cysteine desulfurase NifS [Priestia aryabhattai]TDB49806.1 cysteine desulfurase [Bacillus sp. CBEL-1]